MSVKTLAVGTITGKGVSADRYNEITADLVATWRNWVIGYNSDLLDSVGGVIGEDSFIATFTANTTFLHLSSGMVFAYGYAGYVDSCDIDFLLPASEQYQLIYAELNKSVVPNTCIIYAKSNQNNSSVLANTFRQDVLSTVKTGVFEVPLWQVHITKDGIQEVKDIRNIRKYMQNVQYCDVATSIADFGNIGDVTAVTADEGDSSQLVATTEFVWTEINKAVGVKGL